MFAIPEVGYTLYNLSNHIVKLSNEVLFREKGERGNVEKRRNAKKRKMLKRGIEPQTFALLARRSNQLSYSSLFQSKYETLKNRRSSIPTHFSMRRIVVTGIGAITPFGVGMDHCFQSLIQGKSAIQVTSSFY